jgi:hypothetical protein
VIRLTRTAAPANELPGLMLAAAIATFGALAILGSRNPLILLAAPLGGIGFIFAARRPLVALIILVVVEVTNVSGVLAPHTGIPVFPASMLLGLFAVGFALRDSQARSRLNAWTAVCAGILAVYLATQAVATLGSVEVGLSLASTTRATLDCVFVMLVLVLIQLTARPWVVAGAIVVPLAVLCSLTIINELIFNGGMPFGGFATVARHSGKLITDIATHRYGGPLPDSNFWGRYLVMGLPLAAALLTRALRSGRRSVVALWLSTVILILPGIFLTQSRGTFLAAGAAIVVWFLASERSVRRRGLAMLPLALLVFALPGIGNRLVVAFEDLTQAHTSYNADPSLVRRLAAGQEAWMMFDERPYFGFGPATFPSQVIDFAGRVPTAVRDPTDAAHNLYAEFASESGVLGLIGLAVLILGFLALAVLRILAQPGSKDRVLAAAVCAAIVAWAIASIGLHLAYFRTFGLVLALAGGIAPAWPLAVTRIRRLRPVIAVWLVAAMLGFSASWVYLSTSGSPAVTATQQVTIIPVGPFDGWYAYALDIRSRVEMLPTVATIMYDRGSPVTIGADPVRGVLTFTTTADTADNAQHEIQLAVAHGDTALRKTIGYRQYALLAVGSMNIVDMQARSAFAPLVAAGIGVGTALVAGLALPRALARRRMEAPPGQPSTLDSVSV